MKLLNGKELADEIKEVVKEKVSDLNKKGKDVCLAVIQVGNDKASSVYVKNKEKACKDCGIESRVYNLNDDVKPYILEDTIVDLIEKLNNDDSVDGILVQLPLPSGIDEKFIINKISPEKDVDSFHEVNVGKLMIGEPKFVPCTTLGIIQLLIKNDIEIEGKNCVVVGRSNFRPLRLCAAYRICDFFCNIL